ncbi:MAG: hypothetical protein JXA41_11345 [Deltaproteobacteria bacterium]|nr:hypothetical protein [Deltaproteobacteria bacterium]
MTDTAPAASSAEMEHIYIAPKEKGECRVMILAGDYWHNGIMYETHCAASWGLPVGNYCFPSLDGS